MSSARERLVTSTVGLLRRRGVARRSMYTHFPDGKMQLMVEATRRAYRSTQPLDVVGEHLDATLRLQLARS